ncbi:hypothetical protein [Akkermansia sp.]|uniref:hypothetical protein n=1 Tax=Akkermansia sp. TaxID=1872421 RepID=UPI00399CD775
MKTGLGVDDIRHIPVQERELRFTRNRAGALLTGSAFLLIAIAGFLQLAGHGTITPYLPAPCGPCRLRRLFPPSSA